jgi:membrane protease YdiL (CAAX protease family)
MTRSRGRKPADWPVEPVEFARSLVPLALLAAAAIVPLLRLPVLLLLIGGTVVAVGRDAPVRWAWAATVPVATSLAWGAFLVPQAARGGVECADLTSPLVLFRVAEAVVVLIIVATFAVWLHAERTTLFLRWPRGDVVRLSAIGFLIVGPLGLVVGPLLARPFFGPIDYDATRLAALLPALLFAVANGTMEEVAYRGALLGWSARVVGVWPAVAGQGIVFGLAHSGGDVTGNGLLLILALGAGGILAGAITVRTRSILFPLAIHIGLDIPLYYGLACAT